MLRSASHSLLSPTALALVLTTVLAPLAAADRIDPASERRPIVSPRPVSELPGPSARPTHTMYRVTRLPPNTPVSNEPVPSPSHTGFAQPPAGWSSGSSHSSDASNAVNPSMPSMPVMPPDGRYMRPPVIVSKANVRAALEEARANSLAAFQTYLSNEIYPSNTYTKGALNVWRDEAGHYCAAATIIRISGRLDISEGVASTDNNLRLINVKDGVLMDWILTSGLTQQEIDRIQRPFIGVQPDRPRRPVVGNVDQTKKAAETARLAKTYRVTYAALVRSNKASLEVAVNRLMAQPQLAREFIDGSLAIRDVH